MWPVRLFMYEGGLLYVWRRSGDTLGHQHCLVREVIDLGWPYIGQCKARVSLRPNEQSSQVLSCRAIFVKRQFAADQMPPTIVLGPGYTGISLYTVQHVKGDPFEWLWPLS